MNSSLSSHTNDSQPDHDTPHCFVNRVNLTIESVVYPGKGMGRMPDGRRAFVPGTLPGETVVIEAEREKKSYVDAFPYAIKQSSKERSTPLCPLAPVAGDRGKGCGGCAYQHTTYHYETELKQAQFLEILTRQAGLADPPLLEAYAAPAASGYRSKITLHASRINGEIQLGYISADGDSVIDVPGCPLAADAINTRLQELRANREFMDELQDGDTVCLRHTEHDGVVHWVASYTQTGNDPLLRETTPLGPFMVPRTSFFQVNPAVAAVILNAAGEWISRNRPLRVIDLYCGVGTFALAAKIHGTDEVLGIDQDRRGIGAAKRNAIELKQKSGIHFIAESCDSALPKALQRVPMSGLTLIADPPRSGMSKKVRAVLKQTSPEHILYVSCDPSTLARDIKELMTVGYQVKQTRLYDMFPRTGHFESLTVLKKEPSATTNPAEESMP